jgi:rfaE bifunctional protein kinase chain/domain
MNRDRLEEITSRFSALTIAVVGDYFLDAYLDIDPALAETSLETGLEAHQVVRTRVYPGAAGTLASNLCALGVRVVALGMIGDDGAGYMLRRALAASGMDASGLVTTPDRATPVYLKPLRGDRELSRFDIKNRSPLPVDVEQAILAQLRDSVPRVHGLVCVDQAQEASCGVITGRIRDNISALAREYPRVIFAAESRERIGLFADVIVQANQREACAATGQETLEAAGLELRRRARRAAVVTAGSEGIYIFDERGAEQVRAVPVSGPIDTVGAGDSVCAGMMAALCTGATLREAAEIGNMVASVTIQQIGITGTATRDQVLAAWERSRAPSKA